MSIECEVEGMKLDADKLRWDLIPWGFFEEVVKDVTFGAKKYAPNNWRKVENGIDRYFAAVVRHLIAYRKGEYLDSESGLSHLAMAGCNLMFLWELENDRSIDPRDSSVIQSTTDVRISSSAGGESATIDYSDKL